MVNDARSAPKEVVLGGVDMIVSSKEIYQQRFPTGWIKMECVKFCHGQRKYPFMVCNCYGKGVRDVEDQNMFKRCGRSGLAKRNKIDIILSGPSLLDGLVHFITVTMAATSNEIENNLTQVSMGWISGGSGLSAMEVE